MLKLYKFNVGGFITKEIRENNRRIGFKFIDLENGYEDWLANIYGKTDYTIGKYSVYIEKLNQYLQKLEDKLEKYEVIIIDEIGPMEMLSQKFREIVNITLNKPIPSIYTVHHRISNKLRNKFTTKYDNVLYVITRENRDGIPLIIWHELNKYLRRG
jgi:nucleoside-triphosphatase